jgi:oxygen-independent coproporphyrinogen-3 oxidase
MLTSALYIHIPFCEKRCVYCDFYTVAGQRNRIPDYLNAMAIEAKLRSAETFWRARRFSTIFFGGGTPSLLSPQQLAETLDVVYSSFNFGRQVEITLEANPGTISPKRLTEYRRAGINRLSLGIQSFDADELRLLDRIHSPEQAIECALAARQAGFENLSFDFIFALPGQTLQKWDATLQQAIELDPNHISAYNLIVETGTPLDHQIRKGKISPLSENEEREFYGFTMDFLQRHGYHQYEISNFAKPGYEAKHNIKYWDGSPYLGLGASAHSYDGKRRFWNVANLRKYFEALNANTLPEDGYEKLSREQKIFESVFLGLRQNRGVHLESFRKKSRMEFDAVFNGKATKLEREGFLVRQDGYLRLSREGIFLCDEICAQLEPVEI